jgi:hypothetical protein
MGKVSNKDQPKFFKALESYGFELEEKTEEYKKKDGCTAWWAVHPILDMILIGVDFNSISFMGALFLNDKVKKNSNNRLKLLNMVNELNLRSELVNYSIIVDEKDQFDQLFFKCIYGGPYIKGAFDYFIKRWQFETCDALYEETFNDLHNYLIKRQISESPEGRA